MHALRGRGEKTLLVKQNLPPLTVSLALRGSRFCLMRRVFSPPSPPALGCSTEKGSFEALVLLCFNVKQSSWKCQKSHPPSSPWSQFNKRREGSGPFLPQGHRGVVFLSGACKPSALLPLPSAKLTVLGAEALLSPSFRQPGGGAEYMISSARVLAQVLYRGLLSLVDVGGLDCHLPERSRILVSKYKMGCQHCLDKPLRFAAPGRCRGSSWLSFLEGIKNLGE